MEKPNAHTAPSYPTVLATKAPSPPKPRRAAPVAKEDGKPDRGDDVVVVPDSNTKGAVVWTSELDGVIGKLSDNGIFGYSRKLEPGETPEDGKPWPPKAAAAVERLKAQAGDYMKAHFVTMLRRDYEAMVAGEEDERAARQAEREAQIQANLDKEGVPLDQRHAESMHVYEPKED